MVLVYIHITAYMEDFIVTSKDLEIFNEMPFFFWVKDDEGTYLWVNKALRDMAGEEIVGKKDAELPWSEAAETLRADDIKVLETGKPLHVHEIVQKPNHDDLSVCKFAGDFESKQCAFGVSFVIPK